MASTAEEIKIKLKMSSKKGLLCIGQRPSSPAYSRCSSFSTADGSRGDEKTHVYRRTRTMSEQQKGSRGGFLYGTLFCCVAGGFDNPSGPPSPSKFFNFSLLIPFSFFIFIILLFLSDVFLIPHIF